MSLRAGAAADPANRTRRLHRELWQIVALVVIGAAAFVLTQRLEGASRELRQRDAAEWYRRGSAELQAHNVPGAVDAFRRATAKNRADRRFAVALADALSRSGRTNDARTALLALREAAPDDAEVNLQLARLAATQDDVSEAVRFYQTALYTPVTLRSAETRRTTRLELIRFLLGHQQLPEAAAEVMALSVDLPDTADAHLTIGRLLTEAGDRRGALDQFAAAVRLAPQDQDALTAAGMAAFAAADYALAVRYLRSVNRAAAAVEDTREIARMILAQDPLAPRLRSAERDRRLRTALSVVVERIDRCVADGAEPAGRALAPHTAAIGAFSTGLPRSLRTLTTEMLEDGVDLILAAEETVLDHCGPATPADTALRAIGRMHSATAP